SPKETVSRSSRSDFATSSTRTTVPTRTSIACSVEIGSAGFTGAGVIGGPPPKRRAPSPGPFPRRSSESLLRLHAPAVGVGPLPLVAEAGVDEGGRRPGALVVGLAAAAVVPGVQVRIGGRLARL